MHQKVRHAPNFFIMLPNFGVKKWERDENNVVKLCDFGLCSEISVGNRITICGTYEYMSPEVVFKKNYNANIDVWSLGIFLFEMITGNTPFVGSSNEEIMLNIKYK